MHMKEILALSTQLLSLYQRSACEYVFHLNGARGKQPGWVKIQTSSSIFICVGWEIVQLKKRYTTLEKKME